MSAHLIRITNPGPVLVRELGTGWEGIAWTVQPENFPQLVEMINRHGGPNAWRISPAQQEVSA